MQKHFDKGSLARATANTYAWNHCVCLKRWQQEQRILALIGLVLTKVKQSTWTPVSLAFTQQKICSCAKRDQSLGCLLSKITTFSSQSHDITDLHFNTTSRHNAFLSEFQVIKTLHGQTTVHTKERMLSMQGSITSSRHWKNTVWWHTKPALK